MNEVQFMGLAPNFAEIIVSKNTITIFEADFEQAFFDECKEEKGDIFYYRRGGKIYAWSRSGIETARPNGFMPVTISLDAHPDVFAKVIQQSIISYFFANGRRPHRLSHSSVYTFRVDGATEYSISNLKFVPHFNFSVGYLATGNRIMLYMTCWREYKRRFEIAESAIRSEGIDTSFWDRRNGEIVASRRNIKAYLDGIRGNGNLKQIEATIHNKTSEFAQIKKGFAQLNRVANDIKVVDGLELLGFQHLAIPNSDIKDFTISRPTHYYYNNGTTSGGSYDQAVANLKPFTHEYTSSRQFNIVAFIPKQHAGTCDSFIQSIRGRLAELFHTKSVNVHILQVGDDRREHLERASTFHHNQYDLALFFLNLADKSQPTGASDYNKLKAKLLGKGIPSQNFLMETVRGANKYTYNNISLNIYAKLGGTPWIISKDSKSALELVIGVGSSIDETNSRTIGFASVFNHQGSYILGGCSPISDMSSYTEKLRDHVTRVVAESIQLQGLEPSGTIRLVFHIFKEASKRFELKAILEAVENFTDYNIEYALVHVSYSHPFKLYHAEGNSVVQRGTYIEISEGWALLSMGGKSASPLLVKLDPRSTYTDLYDLSKQVLHFAHLSHKSFKPANEPVTTRYSAELARRTRDLMTVPHWDIDMLAQLKDRVWFI